MSDESRRAVFLSYASQDAEAARALCDELRAAGVEVWFDQNELVGGDAWDAKIRRQIKECARFVPVISAHTQARREGYFRLEWKIAAQRTHTMADGTPFLLPVVLDATTDSAALVPEEFRAVQWTRLGSAESLRALGVRVRNLLEPAATGSTATGPAKSNAVSVPPPPVATAPSRFWLLPALVGLGLVAALGLWRPWAPPSRSAAVPASGGAAAADAFPRHPALRQALALVERVNSTAEDHALAEDLVKSEQAKRPTDPEVVIVAANVANRFILRGFDLSAERYAGARRLSERALSLAPDEPEAMHVLGLNLTFRGADPVRAAELMRRAVALQPDQRRFYNSLIEALEETNAPDLIEVAERAVARFPQDPVLRYRLALVHLGAGRTEAYQKALDETLAVGPVATAVIRKVVFELVFRQNPAAAREWLERVPAEFRLNDRVVFARYLVASYSGEVQYGLPALRSLPGDFLRDFTVWPKRLLIGDLLARQGKPELARQEYEAAQADLARAKARDPNVIFEPAETWLRFVLGQRDEVRTRAERLYSSAPRPYTLRGKTSAGFSAIALLLWFDERAKALELLREAVADDWSRRLLVGTFRLDPHLAAWRDDAEINALLGGAPGGTVVPVAAPPAPPAPRAAAGSGEGALLAARAKALYEKVGFTRDDLAPAEEFARRATERDPDSAVAWGVRAGVQAAWLFRGWDNSQQRRQDAQAFANRALALDPNEPEALLALSHVLRAQGGHKEAEVHLRRAIATNPEHGRLARNLGYTLSLSGRQEEARAVYREILRRTPRDPLLHYEFALTYGSYGAGDATDVAAAIERLDAALAIQPFASALVLKAALIGGRRGDLVAMRQVLDEVDKLPLGERSEDRSVCVAMWAGLLERRPERVEAAAALTARTYFDDAIMPLRPKAWSLALAHQIAGKDNLARADWRSAEAVLRQRMQVDPGNATYQVELAITLAWLGEREEAARLVAAIEPVWLESLRLQRAALLLRYHAAMGDAAKAAVYLPQVVDQSTFTTRSSMARDPWWEKVRDRPEFKSRLP